MNEHACQLRIGLIGVGLMGRGMAHCLLRAGYRLGIVAHRRREAADELVAAGAWEADSPQALAAACDVVVLCLPSEEVAERVLFGADGIAAAQAGKAGLLVIECSTLRPDVALRFHARLKAARIGFVDAPVTRGPREAMEGRLNALVGGEPVDVERATPVLRAYCEKVFPFGSPGQGYAAKLVNNFLSFNHLAGIAEAMATARAAGLPMDRLLEAIGMSGGQSRVLDGLTPWIAQGQEPRSRVTLATARKDVDYYERFAGALGTSGPVSAGVLQVFDAAITAGLGEQFTPAYLEHVARQQRKPT